MRVLVVNWDLAGSGFVQDDFASADSFASFDAVVIDPGPLVELWLSWAELGLDGTRLVRPGQDFGFARALENLFLTRQRELEDLLLRGGGVLVVRVRPEGEELLIQGDPPRRLTRYAFLPRASLVRGPHHLSLPQGLRFLPRRGKDVQVTAPLHPLAPFLQRFASHGYEAVLTTALGAPLAPFAEVLAQNRVGDPLALDLPVGPGRILFLPALPGAEGQEAGELLRRALAALLSRPLAEEAPAWLENYRLPGEDELRRAQEELARERERLARREEELAHVGKEFEVLRALLFPRGRVGLTEAVAAALAKLGFAVERCSVPVHLLLRSAEGEFLVRAALSPFGPVGPDEHRALLLELDRLRNEERKDARGMLVCLAEPELDPRRRGPQWEEAVERASRDHRFALISAYDLFRAVAQVLAGADPKEIRRVLAQTEGPWKPRF
ncbi:MAG: hypothetical protein ACK42E_00900 [Candidatus Bipolaricaulaceae bacterium]